MHPAVQIVLIVVAGLVILGILDSIDKSKNKK